MPRLPTPGGDNGNWGDILNEYLSVSLAQDGGLKDAVVTGSQIASGVVSENKLTPAVQTKLNQAAGGDTVGPGTATDDSLVRFSGATGKLLKDSPATLTDDGMLTLGTASSLHAAGAIIKLANPAGAEVSLHTSGVSTARSGVSFIKTNGTIDTPTAAVSGDQVGFFGFKGYDGTNTALTGLVQGQIDGTVSDGIVPMRLDFITGTTTANRTARLTIKSDGLVGIGTPAPTHTLTLPSTSTGMVHYNTSDQATNYERVRTFWNSNIYNIISEAGGTGTQRLIRLGTTGNGQSYFELGPAAGPSGASGIAARRDTTTVTNLFQVTSTSMTSTSGVQNAVLIDPTINQSGTAGYTMLKVNATETATGSGSKYLMDLQVGGVSKFSVSNTGVATIGTLAAATGFTTYSNGSTGFEVLSTSTGASWFDVGKSGSGVIRLNPQGGNTLIGPSAAQYNTARLSIAPGADNTAGIAIQGNSGSATVSNKQLTSNVATITTTAAHGFTASRKVVITGVDATFNGTYTISSVPTSTTFTYTRVNADVSSTAASGTATASTQTNDYFIVNTFDGVAAAKFRGQDGALLINTIGGLTTAGGTAPGSYMTLPPSTGQINIRQQTATNNVLSVQGATGHTGNLQEWLDPSGAVLSRVNSSGSIGIGMTVTGGYSMSMTGPAEIIASSAVGYDTTIYGAGGQNVFKRANGTTGSPSAVLNGDTLGSLSFRGWVGGAFTGSKAYITASSAQDWTGSATGTLIQIQTTQNDSTVMRGVATFSHAGQLQLPIQGVNAGITMGGDVQIYRSAADVLQTDDSLVTTASMSIGYVAKTAAYTLTAANNVVDVTSGTHTQTLPTAVGITGREYTIKNSGTGVVTIATTSSQTIDGATTYSLSAQYKYLRVVSNGANWIIVGNN